jgi:hypothetical protein
VQALLDGELERIRQLVATRGEELDAVVRHRVVRRGDHDAEVRLEGVDQERDRGSRQYADPDRVRAG